VTRASADQAPEALGKLGWCNRSMSGLNQWPIERQLVPVQQGVGTEHVCR